MATNYSDSIFKKLGEDRARMDRLGITEIEMAKFYDACGPEGENKDQAFANIKTRFRLSPEDAEWVEEVLGNCAPF